MQEDFSFTEAACEDLWRRLRRQVAGVDIEGKMESLPNGPTEIDFKRQSKVAELVGGSPIAVAAREQLIDKSYGDSIGDPVRIFSDGAPADLLRARIDDKLSRIAKGHSYPGDNDISDLIGYLALLLVVQRGSK